MDMSTWTPKEADFYNLVENGFYFEAYNLFPQISKSHELILKYMQVVVLLRCGKLYQALELISDLENDGLKVPQLDMLKGEVLFELNDFPQAISTFRNCALEADNIQFVERWIQKCQIDSESSDKDSGLTSNFKFTPEQKMKTPPVNQQANIRYQYDQTQSHVSIFLYIIVKNEDQYHVQFEQTSVKVNFDMYNISVNFSLLNEIDPSKSSSAIKPFGIELSLAKVKEEMWTQLLKPTEKQ